MDNRNYDFYDSLTDDEKKGFSPFVLMRWTSPQSNDPELHEWFIERTNEMVNKDHWLLSKDHKPLLWKLYASCGAGMPVKHEYVKANTKETPVKIEKLLAELYPSAKISDIKLLAKSMSKEDRNELFDSMGFDKKQRKEYE